MRNELLLKNSNGFNLSIPEHCVSANFDLTFFKFGYSRRFSRRINPFRLGFENSFVKTHFIVPYEVIGITEAQKYLNSRMSMFFPEWQSRFYEQHGHNNLDIYLDTQRPMLIDVNIRELSRFVEVIKLDIKRDGFGRVCGLKWLLRVIDNSSAFDKYMATGKTDKSLYKEKVVTANYNVFDIYDSQSCKPKFYAGHFDNDFDLDYSKPSDDSMDGYKKFLEEFDDELPSGFYQKRKSNV